MNLRLNRRLLLWLAALAWVGGCRALPPAPPPPMVSSPEEILSRLKMRQEGLKSFQAKGRLTFLSPAKNYSGTALLRGQRPSTLRADVLDILGRSVLSFASNGFEVQVLSPREGKLYQGPATPAHLAAFIPPTVTLPQTISLMVGALPLSAEMPSRWESNPVQGTYLLEWRQPDGSLRERLWVEARDFSPSKDEWFGSGGQLLFRAQFSDYGQIAPGIPGQITLETFAPKAELRLTYREFQKNPALSPGDLALQPPSGVVVTPLP